MQVKLLTQLTMDKWVQESPPPPPAWPEVVHKTPHLQLLAYDGKGSIDLFIERYEGFSVVQCLSEWRKMELLFGQLEGDVADWYVRTTQYDPPPKMWTTMLALLRDCFWPLDYAGWNFTALDQRTKHADETLNKYWEDILYPCRYVDANMP